MAIRTRKSIFSLTDQDIDWYRQAVAALQKLPPSQIGSWAFFANCHGIPPGTATPPSGVGIWAKCQHQTWFFLPWHRAYLVGFEAAVAEQIEKLGGEAEWALPYWDYTDTTHANARELPAAFRDQTFNGSPNALWSPRLKPKPPQTVLTLPVKDVALTRMTLSRFSSPPGSIANSFGGPQTGAQHSGGTSGGIEDLPHNQVHDAIGGLMGDPDTAANDPIFWLHHCNIDRLWEIWRGNTATPRDPSQSQWLTGVSFQIVKEAGQTFNFVSQQALNTQTLLHGYIYDNVPPVTPAVAAASVSGAPSTFARAGSEISAILTSMNAQRNTHMVAAHDGSVDLGAKTVQAPVRKLPVTAAVQEQFRAGPTPHYYMRIENIRASGPARRYRMLIGLSDRHRLPVEIGTLSTFGVAAASDPQRDHADNGITKVFDITSALETLGSPLAKDADIIVIFEPVETGELEDVPDNFPHAERLRMGPRNLTIGTIQIFTE